MSELIVDGREGNPGPDEPTLLPGCTDEAAAGEEELAMELHWAITDRDGVPWFDVDEGLWPIGSVEARERVEAGVCVALVVASMEPCHRCP